MNTANSTAASNTVDDIIRSLGTLNSEQLAEVEAWISTHAVPRKVWGWRSIAEECGFSTTRAQLYAAREFDPLPVEYLIDRTFIYASAARAWMRRQNIPYHTRLKLRSEAHAKLAKKTRNASAKKAQMVAARKAVKVGATRANEAATAE